MADKKNIEQKIKQSFESMNSSAPKGLWDRMADQLDGSLSEVEVDQKIKTSFESQKAKAPEQVYSNIERQLNIDRVWIRINRVLNIDRALFWFGRFALVALIGLLSFWVYQYLFSTEEHNILKSELAQLDIQENPEANVQEIKELEQEKLKKKDKYTQIILKDKDDNKAVIQESKPQDNEHPVLEELESPKTSYKEEVKKTEDNPVLVKAIEFADINKDQQAEVTVNNTDAVKISNTISDIPQLEPVAKKNNESKVPFLAKIETKSPSRIPNTIKPNQIKVNADDFIDEMTLPDADEKKKRAYTFTLGVLASYNQTSINNTYFRQSKESHSLLASETIYKPSFGIMANLGSSENDALVSEIYIKNQLSQSIYGYDRGYYYHKKTNLDYASVSLLYQRKFHPLGQGLNILVKAGVYYAMLKEAELIVDGMALDNSKNYKNHDYGLRLMLGHAYNIKKWQVDYGLNASYGLGNIYEGDEHKSEHFNRTNNYYIGLYLSLKYRLK